MPALALAALIMAGRSPAAGLPARVGTTVQLSSMPGVAGPFAPLAGRAQLGRALFFDARLSEPAGTSCASCHDPAQAFSGNHGSPFGVAVGARPDLVGRRNTPSALYAAYTPPLFFYQDDDAPAPTPFGGLFGDGRVDSLAELAAHPLLERREMHNRTPSDVARKLRSAPYADAFRREFGPEVFATTASSMAALGKAMEAFLQSRDMAPFSSRYDAWVAGKATLSAQERRGLALFKDPDRGNCASCHKFNETSSNPARSMFTDFGYDAIAVPRNRQLPANRDPRHFDLGLCETAAARKWPDSGTWCGYFRTPSLRNVAARTRYMHNGVFGDLRSVVAFYATRSLEPVRWYKDGVPFDDVPRRYFANVNTVSLPYNRRKGMPAALDDADIDAIVAFLATLTDAPFEAAARRNLDIQDARLAAQARHRSHGRLAITKPRGQ